MPGTFLREHAFQGWRTSGHGEPARTFQKLTWDLSPGSPDSKLEVLALFLSVWPTLSRLAHCLREKTGQQPDSGHGLLTAPDVGLAGRFACRDLRGEWNCRSWVLLYFLTSPNCPPCPLPAQTPCSFGAPLWVSVVGSPRPPLHGDGCAPAPPIQRGPGPLAHGCSWALCPCGPDSFPAIFL